MAQPLLPFLAAAAIEANMIRLKSDPVTTEPKPRSSRPPRWGRRLCWLLPLVLLGVVLAERWRGRYALAAWLRDKEAQGEFFDLERLWPPSKPADADFSNRLAQAIGQLPKRWKEYGGMLSGVEMAGPSQARRGSQESQPPMHGGAKATNTWQDLEALVREGEPALHELRKLMKEPAASLGPEVHKQLLEIDEPFPNFVNVRTAAQALQTAALARLHQGEMEGALENMEAFYACNRVYANEPFLVSYMIRIAILGLSDDVGWDALQAEGWSEPQLARLQQACQCDELLPQMPKTLQAELAMRLRGMQWFASHSYEAWLERHEPLLQAFGVQPPACDAGPVVRRWRQWVFHPLWRFAWADQEELHRLQTVHEDLDILRDAVRRQACTGLDQRLAEHRRDYRPPPLSWRFYLSLPLVDRVFDPVGNPTTPAQVYPIPMFTRAWSVTMKNLTIHEMVKTVIALNRYKLGHGQWPERLDALTPDFLPTLPRDFMDGQVLRYRLQADGSFTLYSVGQDGTDDGGDPTPTSPNPNAQDRSPWGGRDWVWPRNGTRAETGGSVTPAPEAAVSARPGE
jgi:hypothetical protein